MRQLPQMLSRFADRIIQKQYLENNYRNSKFDQEKIEDR